MIYLDNSATTRPCAEAVLAAREMAESAWFNPSALYAEAVRVGKSVDAARAAIAETLNAPPGAVVFTAGGTEADALAILGSADRFRGPRRVLFFAAEHPAVLETAAQLTRLGHRATMIPADDEGVLDLDAFAKSLGPDVGLVSLMQVNNTTGAVQPIEAAGRLLREKCPDALFHVDGVQGYLRLPMDMAEGVVDLYATSAHKVHGLKGAGALVVKKGVKLLPRTLGGGQEKGLRSGTENTSGIAAFGAAVQWVSLQKEAPSRLLAMKRALFSRLISEVEGLRVNGPAPDGERAAPHILNVSFPGVGGEVMVHALEAEGVLVGTGAACSSKKHELSAAFAAMRAPVWASESAVRLSLGLMNTIDEINEAAEAAIRCYRRYKIYQRR